jgi:arginine utilization protein RocB
LAPTSESSGYLDTLEDDDINASMSSEEEEEEPSPPCGLMQAALLGSFEAAHKDSSMKAVRTITLEQTNSAIADRITEILVEFAAKEAATKRLIVAE